MHTPVSPGEGNREVQLRSQAIPRREDERNLRLSGRHPAYCTCRDCTDSFLRKRKLKPVGREKSAAEKVRPHPEGCACATCKLLASVDGLPPMTGRRPGSFSRLLGRGG